MRISHLNNRVFFSSFNLDVRLEEIRSRVRNLKGKMKVEQRVQLALGKFNETPCAFTIAKKIQLPPWFLFKYEDIPMRFRVTSFDDPRLVDQNFLNDLAAWMNEKFHEAGLSSVVRQPADHGILQKVIALMRDRDLYDKSKDFTLAHELAHLNHAQVAERSLSHNIQESVSVAGIIGGIFLLFLAVSITPFVHLAVTLTVAGIAMTVSIVAILAWLNKTNSPASVSDVVEEKNADMDAIEALQDASGAIHYFETYRQFNLAVRQSSPATQQDIDANGNNLLDKAHPPLTERIAYIRQWQSQHLQRV
jgi:hypothetical protein